MREPFDVPFKSGVVPNTLSDDTRILFRCHKGVPCFNACCRQADITLTPYDIIRLKQRLGVSSGDFLKKYTVPFETDADGVPGVKMRTKDNGACVHMTDEGCSVYEDRPSSCRYYPLGHLALRHANSSRDETQYVLTLEDHCKGHEEDRGITIRDYLAEQGLQLYREMNREWLQLILKKKSAGPTVGKPPQESLQLYFMACYDVDRFRRFVLSPVFRNAYELEGSTYEALEKDDVALLKFGFRLLRQVLFGERSIPEKEGAWETRLKNRKNVWEARRQAELARRAKMEDDKYKFDV